MSDMRSDIRSVGLDAHVFHTDVVLLVDTLEHVGRLLGAVHQFLEFRRNSIGKVGSGVIRVVAELAIIGVGGVFLESWPCSSRR